MNILFISAEPIRSGQASATHINEIVRCLTAAGHDVTTCSTGAVGPYDQTSVTRRLAAYLVFWITALRRLRRTTLIYARAHPFNFPIAAIGRLFRIPVVQEINGTYHDISITHTWLSPLAGLLRALYRFQYRRASALIAVTAGLADWARSEAPNVQVHTIFNGVNCDIFCPAPPARAVENEYALFFGGLTRWHGIETMIAAAESSAWPSGLDLVIVGDGQLAWMAKQAAARNSRIHALASVPQRVLVGYITGAFVGLVPINRVGERGRFGLSPLKLYEMLACGLPVIVTEFPGQADLVRSLDAGLVVPSDDPKALAGAVAQLRRESPPREKMLRIASIIKAEHSWGNRVAEINKVLNRVVQQGGL
jgi:glycosyltransferase involved in cell wall biosynthesis